MPKIPISKIPLPIPGGPIAKIVLEVVGQAVLEALIEELLDWLKHTPPSETPTLPPVPDPEADEIDCLTQTYHNTLAIHQVVVAIKTGSTLIATAISENTKAVSAVETRIGNLIEILAFALPYVGWTQSVLKAFFDLMHQNSTIFFKFWREGWHLLTGRRITGIDVEDVIFPEVDYEADVSTDGFENRDLDILGEINDPPPAP